MGHSITINGGAKLDNGWSKFGPTSAKFITTGDYIIINSASTATNLGLGTNDFTIDFWVNFVNSPTTNQCFVSNGNGNDWFLYVTDVNSLRWFNTMVQFDVALSVGVHHIAVTRASGTSYAFIDGTLTAIFADTTNYSQPPDGIWVGNDTSSEQLLNGFIDELRIINGTAAWINNFSPPSAPYPDLPPLMPQIVT
jgi:hypothetical protein